VLWQEELNAMLLQNTLDKVRIEPKEAFPLIIFGEHTKLTLNIVTLTFSFKMKKDTKEGYYAIMKHINKFYDYLAFGINEGGDRWSFPLLKIGLIRY
jgi:hypothetical protein